MNVLEAMRDTMKMAQERGMQNVQTPDPTLSWSHMVAMANKMSTEQMSYGKLCRWLGWMQACVVAANINVTLSDMKEINRRHA